MEQLTQQERTEATRYVTAARTFLRQSWAGSLDEEGAEQIEQAEELLTKALAILGEEPTDAVQAWEAQP